MPAGMMLKPKHGLEPARLNMYWARHKRAKPTGFPDFSKKLGPMAIYALKKKLSLTVHSSCTVGSVIKGSCSLKIHAVRTKKKH